jgi:hypothetical protein
MMTRPLPAGEAEDARFELARGCPTAVAEPAREFGVGHDGLRPRDTDCRLGRYTAPGESWLEDGVQHLEQGVQTPAQAPGNPTIRTPSRSMSMSATQNDQIGPVR